MAVKLKFHRQTSTGIPIVLRKTTLCACIYFVLIRQKEENRRGGSLLFGLRGLQPLHPKGILHPRPGKAHPAEIARSAILRRTCGGGCEVREVCGGSMPLHLFCPNTPRCVKPCWTRKLQKNSTTLLKGMLYMRDKDLAYRNRLNRMLIIAVAGVMALMISSCASTSLNSDDSRATNTETLISTPKMGNTSPSPTVLLETIYLLEKRTS